MKKDYYELKEFEVRYPWTDLLVSGVCFFGLEILGLFMIIKGIYLGFSVVYSLLIFFLWRNGRYGDYVIFIKS